MTFGDVDDGSAAVWQDGQLHELAVPPHWAEGQVETRVRSAAINEAGTVVGYAEAYSAEHQRLNSRAIVSLDGAPLQDLNELVNLPGKTLIRADALNDAGQIVAVGQDAVDGTYGLFLMTPVPEPATWSFVLTGLLGLSLRSRLCRAIAIEAEGADERAVVSC
ncbi:hypothetical protein OOT46_26590 [Aquabacterium sp. A7-Y]|uniref:hypothetical protein n=1 Tax=Aquabacterium sp. A7-Y TaxID=1349605 RepID=UPI00223D5C6F|nr:hypothetical protein [Aquabacterium sp. A7-Y]MCW7541384.1 hypothetical protein [Aquabacterium sp. A7-Y]